MVLDSGFLVVCLIQPHFLRSICLATGSCPAGSHGSSFGILDPIKDSTKTIFTFGGRGGGIAQAYMHMLVSLCVTNVCRCVFVCVSV